MLTCLRWPRPVQTHVQYTVRVPRMQIGRLTVVMPSHIFPTLLTKSTLLLGGTLVVNLTLGRSIDLAVVGRLGRNPLQVTLLVCFLMISMQLPVPYLTPSGILVRQEALTSPRTPWRTWSFLTTVLVSVSPLV